MASEINDGGPAFPRPLSKLSSEEVSCDQDGMSLRDYFAAHALAGLLANWEFMRERSAQQTAFDAYLYADEMLKARTS